MQLVTDGGTLLLLGRCHCRVRREARGQHGGPRQRERHRRSGRPGQLRRDSGNPRAGAGDTTAGGRVDLSEGCTLRVEADSTLDKPITVGGHGAPGTTGAVVIAAGVTLTERVELRAGSPAKISVLNGATLDLPDAWGSPSRSVHR